MNFNNRNMDVNMEEPIMKILHDSVIDGNQINITENHFVTLRGIIELDVNFIIILEQIYVNDFDIEPDDFDLNNHEIYQDFIDYIGSLFIMKFNYYGTIYFGLNDIFLRTVFREQNNLDELSVNFV